MLAFMRSLTAAFGASMAQRSHVLRMLSPRSLKCVRMTSSKPGEGNFSCWKIAQCTVCSLETTTAQHSVKGKGRGIKERKKRDEKEEKKEKEEEGNAREGKERERSSHQSSQMKLIGWRRCFRSDGVASQDLAGDLR
jgi:hypothetical protein